MAESKKKKLFIPRKLSETDPKDNRFFDWNQNQPIRNILGINVRINQWDLTGRKQGYWEAYSKGFIVEKGFYIDDKKLVNIIKKQGNIFELEDIDYLLVFGYHNTGSIGFYAHKAGFNNSHFVQQSYVAFPNKANKHVKFISPENGGDEQLRVIIHHWLKDAKEKGKIHLATNGINNPLQPESNLKPEFEMRQFERARLIESLILSWCKYNENNFESITLISIDPDFLEI